MCVLFCENANYNFADFPLGFLLGGLCGWRSKLFVQIGKSCIFVAIKDLCDEDYQV